MITRGKDTGDEGVQVIRASCTAEHAQDARGWVYGVRTRVIGINTGGGLGRLFEMYVRKTRIEQRDKIQTRAYYCRVRTTSSRRSFIGLWALTGALMNIICDTWSATRGLHCHYGTCREASCLPSGEK